ncbi:hypothetical protein FC96_GL002478 [Secundilactobacillus kimchicus JCM 15530]|uniref:D-alanyl-D-alanine carboxypeptidase n=1 Tax=Secundilactobacillus kimchicus JCM 15530 TaxID=1302272 RepID=A0A0R1HLT8_9LACO|nr:hypothetical protein [Secundilactobacillus kimchicus]KRK47359.1 hypothetical protein FC96_GL002478 [Secundilactobacillus kimchicus JCM 15530]
MKKSHLFILIAVTLGIGLASFASFSTTASAAYKTVKSKTYSPAKPYHQAVIGGSALMWNARHTAYSHNMQNYPTTTWYVTKSVKMVHGKSSTIFWRVRNQQNTVTGYVARGYFTKGINPNSVATGNDHWQSEISPMSQKVLDLFTGTIKDPALQAMANYSGNYSNPDQSVPGYARIMKATYGAIYSHTQISYVPNSKSPLTDFRHGKIALEDYINSTITDNGGNYNTQTHKGQKIGAYFYPKNSLYYGNGIIIFSVN